MPWREAIEPVRMERVAVVAPRPLLRDVLVRVAERGQVELDVQVDPDRPATTGQADDVPDGARARGAALDAVAAEATERDGVAALTGWAIAGALPELRAALAPAGGTVVVLETPPGTDPPTLLPGRSRLHEDFSPLVSTYGTVPYADVDPTVVAGLAYVAMFGMMFGDVGHGLLLVGAALVLRSGRVSRLAKVASAWPFVLGAGVAATVVGFLYGELFGPIGLIDPLWLSPTDNPVTVLVAGIAVGAVLLAGAYGLGTVNRWREGGWPIALYAPSGVAGIALFLGLGAVAVGVYVGEDWGRWLVPVGVATWVTGLTLVFVGLLYGAGLTVTGAVQAFVELLDTVLQVGANLLSFARLAAFGLAHAALSGLVWDATRDLAGGGPLDWLWAVVVFLLGNALAFALEGLVAAVQALRLEYYELFSRVFQGQGRPFRPWHLPAVPAEPAPRRSESLS